MSYIGKSPAAAVLTASDITDAIITKAKLADEVDVFAGTSHTTIADPTALAIALG